MGTVKYTRTYVSGTMDKPGELTELQEENMVANLHNVGDMLTNMIIEANALGNENLQVPVTITPGGTWPDMTEEEAAKYVLDESESRMITRECDGQKYEIDIYVSRFVVEPIVDSAPQ